MSTKIPSSPLRTDEVLSQEAEEILRRRKQEHPANFKETGRSLYRDLNECKFAALCLSGGGIRSAAFGLGIIQALASYPRSVTGREWDSISETELEQRATNSFLGQFDYLSTVSGGGYIGSWLSAWCASAGFQRIWQNLIARPDGPDLEPIQIGWLRSYSNYLTPKIGLMSADAWSAISIYICNLLLNWMIILPLFCCAIIGLKILVVALDAIDVLPTWFFPGAAWFENERLCYSINPIKWQPYVLFCGIPGILLLIAALAFVARHCIAGHSTKSSVTQASFLCFALLPSLISAILLAPFLGSFPIGQLFQKLSPSCEPMAQIQGLPVARTKDNGLAKAAGISVGDVIEQFGDRKVATIWELKEAFNDNRTKEQVELDVVRNGKPRKKLLKLAGGSLGNDVGWDDLGIEIGSTGRLQLKEPLPTILGFGGALGMVIYLISYLVAWTFERKKPDARGFVAWLISGFTFGVVAVFAYCFFATMSSGEELADGSPLKIFSSSSALPLTIGVPWVLCSQLLSFFMFVGLSSYRSQSDADREWLGRAAGWLLSVALLWFAISFFTFGTALLTVYAESAIELFQVSIVPISGISGLLTAVLSKADLPSPVTPRNVRIVKLANIGLSITATLFIACLIVILSNLLDKMLLGQSPLEAVWIIAPSKSFIPLFAGLALFIAIGCCASYFININRFSLHALYRDRLVRAFLGATRTRKPDPFTGFDNADNPKMHTLWPGKSGSVWQPFHIVNLTLNLVLGQRLSWQERKAAPFTVSPLHCGTGSTFEISHTVGSTIERSRGAYRGASEYADGISLGTAMAISGAAVSPNMGYHSSPAVTFLMSMLNVRLGWWLGNPAFERDRSYAKSGPTWAILPLLQETLGLTTGDRRYIYLSDGGHFDNLGLYEMIRRRCRFILVVDAGCDPQMSFEDLGNALRKIAIDLDVSVKFFGLEAIKKRDHNSGVATTPHCYHAVGEIDYQSTDGASENGIIVYIKPTYYGIEGAAIRAYAVANVDFPHQSILDQWFSESQFESYRALGFEIMERILTHAMRASADATTAPKLADMFGVLRKEGTITSQTPRSESIQY
jgi:hypothetical protein